MTGTRLDRRPSLTAQINAAQRAAETLLAPARRLLDDPYSRHFVRHPVLRAMVSHRLLADAAIRLFDRLWGGLHAHVVLRVRYVDDVCHAAIADGIDQLVLLGAGFDTTSLRLSDVRVTVYEVDAPTTQREKRSMTEHLPHNRQTIWVPCDFEDSGPRAQLLHSGFDPARPSVIIWIGVSPYLTSPAIDQTLTDLAALCAAGSYLVLDYIDASVVTASSRWKSARRVARVVARRGEPYRSGFTVPALDSLLAVYGFTSREHVSVPVLLRRYDPARMRRLADDGWLAIVFAQRAAHDNPRAK